mmetsp:Transcript_31286/g.50228  ORF Transcript_31286/g.50228 Transcript_31286/m.50228 type:complete len:304 (+) Transcript_31286:90-1001(+)
MLFHKKDIFLCIMQKVLVTGGSGNVGRFLVSYLVDHTDDAHIGYTFRSNELEISNERVHALKIGDLSQPDQVASLLASFRPDVIVNCAALARPGYCEQHPDEAEKINVPSALIDRLEGDVFVIHLSTDCVYSGNSGGKLYTEQSETEPVNVYGRTKLAGEKYLQTHWPNSVSLRCSMIYGPLGASFPGFVDGVLSRSERTSFFYDEYRSPVFCGDIGVAIVCFLRKKPRHQVYNMGGPERLSRLEMALCVASFRGADASLVVRASCESVDRGFRSPRDTGMDSSRLVEEFGLQLTRFECYIKK